MNKGRSTDQKAAPSNVAGGDVSSSELFVLRRLAGELQRAESPSLDWQRVETSLMKRIEMEELSRQGQRASRRSAGATRSVLGFALAAAAVVLLLFSQGTRDDASRAAAPHAVPPMDRAHAEVRGPTSTSPGVEMVAVDEQALPAEREEGQLPTYLVDKMTPRSVVMSGDEPMRFTLTGVATWVLAPHSKAVVETTAIPHMLTLEQGSVHAEVVPRQEAHQLLETFVVDVGNTRVAVHGTVLSVARDSASVMVEVTRGSVTVGPAGYRGTTTGHLLVGPARASFSLQGARLQAVFDPSEIGKGQTEILVGSGLGDRTKAESAPGWLDDATVRAPSGSSRGSRRAPGTQEAEPSDPAPTEPAVEDVELTAASARALVSQCLATSATAASGETRVTISSEVTAVVDHEGKVVAVRFSPPLKPELQQQCGGTLFGRAVQGAKSVSFRVDVSKH